MNSNLNHRDTENIEVEQDRSFSLCPLCLGD